MIEDLMVRGYRRFEHLTVNGLAPLNLIVGTNNSGKSSLLEAILLLSSYQPGKDLLEILKSRGEVEQSSAASLLQAVPSSLFYGRTLESGNEIQIEAPESDQFFNLSTTLRDGSEEDPIEIGFVIKSSRIRSDVKFPTSDLRIPLRRVFETMGASKPRPILIPNTSIPQTRLQHMWEDLKLKGKDHEVVSILRTLDPDIVDLDYFETVGTSKFQVKLKSAGKYVPILTMGDGVYRLLVIAIASASVSGEILLIDEVDTAFHYSVLGKVWKLLSNVVSNSNTQIIATTHSKDCIEALGELVADNTLPSDTIALHRIAPDGSKATRYSGEELQTAVQYELEVR